MGYVLLNIHTKIPAAYNLQSDLRWLQATGSCTIGDSTVQINNTTTLQNSSTAIGEVHIMGVGLLVYTDSFFLYGL